MTKIKMTSGFDEDKEMSSNASEQATVSVDDMATKSLEGKAKSCKCVHPLQCRSSFSNQGWKMNQKMARILFCKRDWNGGDTYSLEAPSISVWFSGEKTKSHGWSQFSHFSMAVLDHLGDLQHPFGQTHQTEHPDATRWSCLSLNDLRMWIQVM